jgi:WhiB family redox-sensing transcriptional regulator
LDLTEDWRHDAACIGVDPDVFFPAEGMSEARAKAICAGCRVRDECLAYSIETRMDSGVWGGLTGPERRMVRRSLRRAG